MFELPDINIPVAVFLIVYFGYMLFYCLYSLFNIYHLIRYGVYGFGLYLIVTIFTGGTILLVAGSVFLLMGYDWMYPISINGIFNNNGADLFPNL